MELLCALLIPRRLSLMFTGCFHISLTSPLREQRDADTLKLSNRPPRLDSFRVSESLCSLTGEVRETRKQRVNKRGSSRDEEGAETFSRCGKLNDLAGEEPWRRPTDDVDASSLENMCQAFASVVPSNEQQVRLAYVSPELVTWPRPPSIDP
ncbi:unnamed protein product [Caenorhabditis auriculariae]|uniref:Uncharacterized protein n=1 Tax=Caenorhabditis auriculariae TaxID=2777116 RepID=A0A8S1H556_9PELO|nr:unnamed protein product [Caenorhabditis auriculariae]